MIVRDAAGRRQYWGETGLGLAWMPTPDQAWVYDTKTQAEVVYRAARLAKQHATIITA